MTGGSVGIKKMVHFMPLSVSFKPPSQVMFEELVSRTFTQKLCVGWDHAALIEINVAPGLETYQNNMWALLNDAGRVEVGLQPKANISAGSWSGERDRSSR
jgi:hypothetical protein